MPRSQRPDCQSPGSALSVLIPAGIVDFLILNLGISQQKVSSLTATPDAASAGRQTPTILSSTAYLSVEDRSLPSASSRFDEVATLTNRPRARSWTTARAIRESRNPWSVYPGRRHAFRATVRVRADTLAGHCDNGRNGDGLCTRDYQTFGCPARGVRCADQGRRQRRAEADGAVVGPEPGGGGPRSGSSRRPDPAGVLLRHARPGAQQKRRRRSCPPRAAERG